MAGLGGLRKRNLQACAVGAGNKPIVACACFRISAACLPIILVRGEPCTDTLLE
jgi:hypothetical protein